MQLRHPRRAQKLVARVSEQPDIVGSFFAPNRKIKNQVLSASRNFQRCLTSRQPGSAREPPIVHEDPRRLCQSLPPSVGLAPTTIPPPRRAEQQRWPPKISTRRRWIADCLRNSLNSWKHGLHEPRWSSQGSASVRDTFPCAMPLSRAFPGQPILSGLGNSVAKPCRRISSKRLSAALDWLSLLRESQLANSSI